MRTMLKVTIDVEAGSKAIQTGELPQIIAKLSEQIKPEAAYFGAYHGERAGYFVFDMTDSSNMPVWFEPLFMKLKAKVEVMPIMSQSDLEKGMMALMQS